VNENTQNVLHVSNITPHPSPNLASSVRETLRAWAQLHPEHGSGPALPFRAAPGRGPVKLRGYLPVVKLQERPLSGLPAASLMLVEMVAVYFVLAARVTFGFSVATLVVAL